jgi:hypothetical protein
MCGLKSRSCDRCCVLIPLCREMLTTLENSPTQYAGDTVDEAAPDSGWCVPWLDEDADLTNIPTIEERIFAKVRRGGCGGDGRTGGGDKGSYDVAMTTGRRSRGDLGVTRMSMMIMTMTMTIRVVLDPARWTVR